MGKATYVAHFEQFLERFPGWRANISAWEDLSEETRGRWISVAKVAIGSFVVERLKAPRPCASCGA